MSVVIDWPRSIEEEVEAWIQNSGMSLEAMAYVQARLRAGGVLSDKEILAGVETGSIFISPFDRRYVKSSSVDVRLGRHFYREKKPEPGRRRIYNPFDQSHVERVWGAPDDFQVAENAGEWMAQDGTNLEGISPDEEIIWINPGETILAHTLEFIGGSDAFITTMMKARSSSGRNFLGVCKCAGWGDVGYHNRWTMEITNFSPDHMIPLVVGRPYAQMVFFHTGGTDTPYYATGKYMQDPLTAMGYEELEGRWHPSAMLPKMYKDRANEVVAVVSG